MKHTLLVHVMLWKHMESKAHASYPDRYPWDQGSASHLILSHRGIESYLFETSQSTGLNANKKYNNLAG